MYIEDLSTEPRGPSAANMWARELEREHGPLVTRSVGWLGATVRSSGPVDPVILAALKHYTSWPYVEDGWMGFHTCEICNSVSSHGEVWIIWVGSEKSPCTCYTEVMVAPLLVSGGLT